MDSFLDSLGTSLPLSSPSSQQNQQQNHPNLTTQYSNVPDNYILEELFHKIQYYNKRASNYYILIDLFSPDTVESEVPTPSLNEFNISDDSGLDSSFTST